MLESAEPAVQTQDAPQIDEKKPEEVRQSTHEVGWNQGATNAEA